MDCWDRRLLAILSAATRSMFGLSHNLFNFPSLNEDKTQNLISEARLEGQKRAPGTSLDLNKTKLRDKTSYLSVAVFAAIAIGAALKLILLTGTKMSLFNYANLSSNFHYPSRHHDDDADNRTLVSFSCMTTNCGRLSSDRSLEEDLMELPTLDICRPALARFYPHPLRNIERICLLVFTVFTYSHIVNGLVVPILLAVSPRANECCLFIRSPRLAIALIRQRTSTIVQKTRQSRATLTSDTLTGARAQPGPYTTGAPPCHLPAQTFRPSERHAAQQNHRDFVRPIAGDDTCPVAAYLPVVRSDWFRRRLVIMSACLTISMLITVLGMFDTLSVRLVNQISTKKMGRFAEFDREMRAQSCSISMRLPSSSSSSSSWSRVDVTSFDLISWSCLGSLELIINQFGPSFITCVLFMTFILTTLEIICWQSELRNQLLFLLEFKCISTQIFDKHHLSAPSYSRWPDQERYHRPISSPAQLHRRALHLADITMRKLREQFMQANRLSLFLVQTNLIRSTDSELPAGSRLGSALALRNLSLESLDLIESDGEQVEANQVLAILSERIYVNLCLYLELLGHYRSSLAVVIGQSYFILIGTMLATIWYVVRISSEHFSRLLIMVTLAWIYTNYILLMSSVVHAKGKNLHKIIWSLIAQYSSSREDSSGESCLIDLWLKRVIGLDSIGGVALDTFGIRVTYVKMVQLVVWAGTMAVFSMQV